MLEGEGQNAANGVILLLTSGSHLPLTHYDLEQMDATVIQRGVRIVPILYPVTSQNTKPTLGVEQLAVLSGRWTRQRKINILHG